jgi:hypothetical protein
VIAQDFAFRGNKAGNRLLYFRDHGQIMVRAALPPGQPGRNGHVPLDAVHANAAAAIHEQTQVSVADAHIGATLQSAPRCSRRRTPISL